MHPLQAALHPGAGLVEVDERRLIAAGRATTSVNSAELPARLGHHLAVSVPTEIGDARRRRRTAGRCGRRGGAGRWRGTRRAPAPPVRSRPAPSPRSGRSAFVSHPQRQRRRSHAVLGDVGADLGELEHLAGSMSTTSASARSPPQPVQVSGVTGDHLVGVGHLGEVLALGAGLYITAGGPWVQPPVGFWVSPPSDTYVMSRVKRSRHAWSVASKLESLPSVVTAQRVSVESWDPDRARNRCPPRERG